MMMKSPGLVLSALISVVWGLASFGGCDSDGDDTVSGEMFCEEVAQALCDRLQECQLDDANCFNDLVSSYDCGKNWASMECPADKLEFCSSGYLQSAECSELQAGELPPMPADCKGICN